MGKFTRPLWLIGMTLALSGCITYGGQLSGAHGPVPAPAAGAKPTIAVDVNASMDLPYEDEHEPTPSEGRRLGKKMVDGLAGTGHFSFVNVTGKPADITLKMDVVKRYDNNAALNLLWYFSYFLIPTYANEYYDFRVEVTDHRSGHTFNREVRTKVSRLFHLLLLPASPFLGPERAQTRMMHALSERVVTDMVNEGMLQGGVPARLSRVSHPAPYAIDN